MYETHAHIGADGTLIVRGIPAEFVHSDVRVMIEKAAATNGRAGESRDDVLRHLAGSISDPTFRRPPQTDFEERQRLD